jgi:major membrane immunogen (membrane-anchored lipoprotein)
MGRKINGKFSISIIIVLLIMLVGCSKSDAYTPEFLMNCPRTAIENATDEGIVKNGELIKPNNSNDKKILEIIEMLNQEKVRFAEVPIQFKEEYYGTVDEDAIEKIIEPLSGKVEGREIEIKVNSEGIKVVALVENN